MIWSCPTENALMPDFAAPHGLPQSASSSLISESAMIRCGRTVETDLARDEARIAKQDQEAVAPPLAFPPHVACLLILAQRHKSAMPKVGVLRPLNKLELPDERGFRDISYWAAPVQKRAP